MISWQPGGFTVNTDQGPRTVAGWVKHPFGLDFRVWWDRITDDHTRGWLLTHIPTGFQAFGILTDLETAFDIADRVEALGNWEFTDPEDKEPLVPPVRALLKELGDQVATRPASIAPLYRAPDEARAA